MTSSSSKPVVLCFSGLDPTGGAGIQADIEAISSQGAHAAPVITALTVQNTLNVEDFQAVDAKLIIQQARSLLEDMPVAAIKIGMLGSIEVTEAIHSILMDYPKLPVIFDPVMSAGGGSALMKSSLADAIKSLILPLCKIITPNIPEAHQLAQGADTHDAAAIELLDLGAEYVLLTGSHDQTHDINHKLFSNNRLIKSFNYQRLEGEYHGSGCTLAASLAGLIAQSDEMTNAVHSALDYTYKTLLHAQRLGMGQLIPDRFFWIK